MMNRSRGSCFCLRGSLFARLHRHMVSDCAAGNRTKHRMVMHEMPRHRSDHCAFQAPGLRRGNRTGQHKSHKHSGNLTRHPVLRSLVQQDIAGDRRLPIKG